MPGKQENIAHYAVDAILADGKINSKAIRFFLLPLNKAELYKNQSLKRRNLTLITLKSKMKNFKLT